MEMGIRNSHPSAKFEISKSKSNFIDEFHGNEEAKQLPNAKFEIKIAKFKKTKPTINEREMKEEILTENGVGRVRGDLVLSGAATMNHHVQHWSKQRTQYAEKQPLIRPRVVPRRHRR